MRSLAGSMKAHDMNGSRVGRKADPWIPFCNLLIYLLIAGLPFILTVLIVNTEFHTPLSSFVPNGSDEVDYWLEVRGASTCGLAIGSFNNDENLAALGLRQFGPHGPAYPLLFAPLATISGWHYSTAIYWNAAFIAVSIFCFLASAKLQGRDLLLFTFLVPILAPILLFIPYTVQESLHFCLAMLLATSLRRIFSRDAELVTPLSRPRLTTAFFLLALLALLLRPTWAIALAGLVPFVSWRDRSILTAEILLSMLAMKFTWVATSPVLSSVLGGGSHTTLEILGSIFIHLGHSLTFLFTRHGAYPMEVVLRFQVMLLIVGALAMSIVGWSKHSRERQTQQFYLVMNLGGMLVLLLLFYDMFALRDFRALAPPLILSLCITIGVPRLRRILIVVAISNVLLFPMFLTSYQSIHAQHFQSGTASIERFQKEISPDISYSADSSMWDNTLLFAPSNYEDLQTFLGLPPGFGLSICFGQLPLQLPPRSRYIIADSSRLAEWGNNVRLRPIRMTSRGMLFENLSRQEGRKLGN